MKTLNLIDLDKSDIKYKISRFPDGQQNIVITKFDILKKEYHKIASHNYINIIEKYPIQIKSRLNNWLDLELITCTVASLRELEVEEIHLYVPYIMGARSDRKFEEGGNNYVKHVIAPAINSLNFKSVTCIDPHSDVLEACINNFKKEDNLELVKWATRELFGVISEKGPRSQYPCVLVSPDAGASKKIYKLAEQIGYKSEVIICSKDRDENGKLTKTQLPMFSIMKDKDYVIIDDICDGGATFINIAKIIKEYKHFNGKIYFIVTHGIFSKGLEELGEYFDGIYCTNSYQDYEPDNDGQDYIYPHLVKQLNVF